MSRHRNNHYIKAEATGQEIYETNHDGKGFVKTKLYRILEVRGNPSLPNNNVLVFEDGVTVPVLVGNVLTDSQIEFLRNHNTDVEYAPKACAAGE
jgi:hypothetical protein